MTTPLELSNPEKYIFLRDNQSLHERCLDWQEMDFLAFDTEFIRTSTFYPKIGLIQICDGQENFLIDPLIIDDWTLLKEILLAPGIVKIFHSCSEDMLVFLAFLDIVPSPIFDTQIATAFLNEGFALSYQNLVNKRKNIELPKGETRSDWLQRPLTDEQLKYAALDVAYLPEIYAWQKEQLQLNGKLSWLQEECARLVETYQSEGQADFNDYYLTMKSAWQVKGYQLAALKNLAAWREERARKRDKPRSWIIKDKELIAIAKLLPTDKYQISNIQGIPGSFVKYEGDQVIKVIQQVESLNEDQLPPSLPPPLSSGQKNKLKKAQQFCEEKAQSLSLPIELLARKRCLTALLSNMISSSNSEQTNLIVPQELDGWRKPLLLEDLVEIMQ